MGRPAYPDTPITVRSLLSHTSSLRSAPSDESLAFTDVKKRLQGRGYSNTRPGSMDSWLYNNYAFDVLGITLELASGQSVNEILKDHFFCFMDIDAAFSAGDIDRTDLLATLYRSDGSVYGVYNCLSYDPDTGDGIAVLTVGAVGSKDENGIYKICSAVNEAFYSRGQ